MPTFSDFTFPSSTGKNTIHARLCMPDGEPRGIIQIAHGIAEYIDRYDPFMQFLAENGFIAVGNDHLGHGKSIASAEEQGIFAEEEGWSYVLKDMDALHDRMHAQYPDLPYIFFGHSMGSFLTRNYIIDHPDKPDLAIICGTGHQPKLMVWGGYTMARHYVRKDGPRGDGTKLNNIAFGSYNKGYDSVRTDFDWLNRDATKVDEYISVPLCGFVASVSLFRDMMGGIKYISDPKNIAKMNKDTPILFIAGGADPVGENGKGVERAYKAFCKAGMRDVFMRIYPDARHEILNELNHEEVFRDVLNWINEKLTKK